MQLLFRFPPGLQRILIPYKPAEDLPFPLESDGCPTAAPATLPVHASASAAIVAAEHFVRQHHHAGPVCECEPFLDQLLPASAVSGLPASQVIRMDDSLPPAIADASPGAVSSLSSRRFISGKHTEPLTGQVQLLSHSYYHTFPQHERHKRA